MFLKHILIHKQLDYFPFYAINQNIYLYIIKHNRLKKLIDYQEPKEQKTTGEISSKTFFEDIEVIQTR